MTQGLLGRQIPRQEAGSPCQIVHRYEFTHVQRAQIARLLVAFRSCCLSSEIHVSPSGPRPKRNLICAISIAERPNFETQGFGRCIAAGVVYTRRLDLRGKDSGARSCPSWRPLCEAFGMCGRPGGGGGVCLFRCHLPHVRDQRRHLQCGLTKSTGLHVTERADAASVVSLNM